MVLSKRFAASVILLMMVSVESFFAVIELGNNRGKTVQPKHEVIQAIIQKEPGWNESEPSSVREAVKNISPEIVVYKVKPGDTLESISRAHRVKINTITGSNKISQETNLKVGQELRFPSVDGILYKISSGETLWWLSSTYGIDIDIIAGINNISSPDKLKIGQEVIIPGAESAKAVFAVQSSTDKELASRKISTFLSSSSTWPLRGPISSWFGPRWGTVHKGIDIAVPTGTTVHAFMNGTISFSGWEDGYGYLVVIDHEKGLQSYYGHNSKLLVKAGQSIAKGQVISKSGNTGYSTGPHLHFEIRKNGEAVNPLGYLK